MKVDFVIIDESGEAPIPDTARLAITQALMAQLNGEVSVEWGGGSNVRWGTAADALSAECVAWLKPMLPEAPDAEAYHATLPNGAPVSYFAMADISGLTSGASCLSVVLSHEFIETRIDPGANRFAMKADGATLQALEGCDRVQANTYAAPNGVWVSNFLLQSAFCPNAPGPWDYQKVLQQGEATAPGGYAITIGATIAAAAAVTGDLSKRARGPWGRVQRRLDSLNGGA